MFGSIEAFSLSPIAAIHPTYNRLGKCLLFNGSRKASYGALNREPWYSRNLATIVSSFEHLWTRNARYRSANDPAMVSCNLKRFHEIGRQGYFTAA